MIDPAEVRKLLERVRRHAMRGISWTGMLAVAVPVVYAAGAFQSTAGLNTPPSPYASMLHVDGVRAILADGWTLTPDEAQKLESEIERDAENLGTRIRLLSYYTQYMVLPDLRSKHLLWLIEHHPDSDIFGLNTVVTAIAADPNIERARTLWLQQSGRYAESPKVLANAATALGSSDGTIAFEVLRRLRALEPQNPEWLDWQAGVYALLSEIALLKDRFGADPELHASKAFAKQLQLRVEQLKSR